MFRWFSHIDFSLAIPAGILIVFSLITLFSINQSFFLNQLVFSFICCGIFLVFSHLDLEDFAYMALPLYGISLLLLFIVLLIGFESRGAVRWIDILGFRIQFSELLKPVFIFCLAVFLTNTQKISVKRLGVLILLVFPVLFFIYRQPDLGNAIIYLLVAGITLVVYGLPVWWFLLGGIIFGISIPFTFRFLHTYQKERLFSFLHMTNDPFGTSYNAIQSIIAVGSGGFWGKGLGQGTQSALRFLPERHTDFLFATVSEDLGFFGAFLIIGTFVFLFYRLFIIFLEVQNHMEKVFTLGACSLLVVQFFINVGMNIGLLPIVGVTLPFMSYGGSSLLSNTILLGIASSISYRAQRKYGLVIG